MSMVRRYDYSAAGQQVPLLIPEYYIPPGAVTLFDEDGLRVRFELDTDDAETGS